MNLRFFWSFLLVCICSSAQAISADDAADLFAQATKRIVDANQLTVQAVIDLPVLGKKNVTAYYEGDNIRVDYPDGKLFFFHDHLYDYNAKDNQLTIGENNRNAMYIPLAMPLRLSKKDDNDDNNAGVVTKKGKDFFELDGLRVDFSVKGDEVMYTIKPDKKVSLTLTLNVRTRSFVRYKIKYGLLVSISASYRRIAFSCPSGITTYRSSDYPGAKVVKAPAKK